MDEGVLHAWGEACVAYHARFASYGARSAARAHRRAYLQGLRGSAERKNGWQRAEAARCRARPCRPSMP